MGTAHNNAEKGQIADCVIMPGDPVRAKYIADNYFENAVCFNNIRGINGYTGTYKGKRVSVMASGMGMPSMGIYSYELYNYYDVTSIIRIGTAGALSDKLKLMDVVIAMGACTDSNYASQFNLPGTFAPIADYELLRKATDCADNMKISTSVGNIVSSDVFYNDNNDVNESWKKMGVLAVDMETAALYDNANRAGKKALSILTVSDHLFRDEHLLAEERSTSVDNMIKLALEIA
jgi:purine-nucleoside phosphorylase